jgi:hypothetical protein
MQHQENRIFLVIEATALLTGIFAASCSDIIWQPSGISYAQGAGTGLLTDAPARNMWKKSVKLLHYNLSGLMA